MVLLYQAKKPPRVAQNNIVAEISALDYQGVGVAKINGKTWFIENALPGERVQFKVTEEKGRYGKGTATRILQPSAARREAKCPHYAQCGGCQSQHIDAALQRESKQHALFRRLRALQAEQIEMMPMIVGEQWQYRRRARLSLMFDIKSKRLILGFRQKNSQDIVPIRHCDVLVPALNDLLPKLTALFADWSAPKALGHIELVAADNGVAMLLRHMGKAAEQDRKRLLAFAEQERLMLFWQDDAVEHWFGGAPYYRLSDGTQLYFDIRDFIQINGALNQRMIDTATDWLDLNDGDNLLDLFCGMGNFTLPLSRKVKSAVGIEGVSAMVEKAGKNAERNQCHNVQFYRNDLDQPFADQAWTNTRFNKILLDPPRSGAAFALNALCALGAEKVLYVSCNPATLVRDAEILLNFGYRLKKAAMIDMFPNTGHLESISLFEKQQ
ncbi:23S rRNA (uracil(1939)-C(5))-methyltransferase RlmD [Caviibacterium pharyngocola]|uniref:23S rRNA (uracil(1939)-C(5))-methyltransferase RlmD n=1 Tax=Caviibacterium pharyngocola TaxID=28159 RepID=A0A2M8RSS4_9PAST|nr:23S rRNA (uracil(1939)-C(5))-methyltransferase RlmD [Caviibacterium pharyngocola]PJG81938.1 23S rRNA (uracil(1939)-C(5))-methyltransferase RlmD [Caviibacterium pharyngocola]